MNTIYCLKKGKFVASSAVSPHPNSSAVRRSFFASALRHSRASTLPIWRAVHICICMNVCVYDILSMNHVNAFRRNANHNRTHYVKLNVTLPSWQLAELIRSRIVVCSDTLLNTFWQTLALVRAYIRSQVCSFCCCNCALSFYFHELGSRTLSLSCALSAVQTCSIPENLFGLRACCFVSQFISLSLSHTAPLRRQ